MTLTCVNVHGEGATLKRNDYNEIHSGNSLGIELTLNNVSQLCLAVNTKRVHEVWAGDMVVFFCFTHIKRYRLLQLLIQRGL